MIPNSVSVVSPIRDGGPNRVLPPGTQSGLFKDVVQNNEFAPLLKSDRSWTKCAPYKEQHLFRTPSESIGNNYSPAAANLKVHSMDSV